MKRLEPFLVYFVILWLVVGAVIQARHVYAGMMGDLPKATAQYAVYYKPLPPTFSIYSEKGMLLYAGAVEVVFHRNGEHKGVYFFHEGLRRFLVLKDDEAVLIKPDPDMQPMHSGARGPRK